VGHGLLGTYFVDAASRSLGTSIFLDDAIAACSF
jgi:hypothetical protein